MGNHSGGDQAGTVAFAGAVLNVVEVWTMGGGSMEMETGPSQEEEALENQEHRHPSPVSVPADIRVKNDHL